MSYSKLSDLPELSGANYSNGKITFNNNTSASIKTHSKFGKMLINVYNKVVHGEAGIIEAKVGTQTVYLNKEDCKNYVKHAITKVVAPAKPGTRYEVGNTQDNQLINQINAINQVGQEEMHHFSEGLGQHPYDHPSFEAKKE